MAKNNKKTTEETVTVPKPKPGLRHKEKIRIQILAKVGKPPNLDRIEMSEHDKGRWRVNIWEQQPEADKFSAITKSPRIALSYYLHVSDEGDIVSSNPPLKKLYA